MSKTSVSDKQASADDQNTPSSKVQLSQASEPPPYKVHWATLTLDVLNKALEIGEECGCNPRSRRPQHAQNIATAMNEGDWQDAIPDIVCLCEHGGVCNGRHRCIAAIESGVALTGWVALNVPRQVIRCADIGLKRTPADALAGRGVTSYRTAKGATVRLLRLYDTKADTHWTLWGKTRYSAPKIGQLFDEHYGGVEDIVDQARQIESGTNCTPSAALAFAFLVQREGDAERLAQVAYGLAGGTADVRDPLAVARTRLSREAKNRGRKADANRAPYELGLLITAVMAGAAGRSRFTFGPTSAMPRLSFAPEHLTTQTRLALPAEPLTAKAV